MNSDVQPTATTKPVDASRPKMGGEFAVVSKDVSEKAVDVLTDRLKVEGLSYIDKYDRELCIRLLVMTRLFFDDDAVLLSCVKDYLQLSLSLDGRGGDRVVDLFRPVVVGELMASASKSGVPVR